MLLLPTLSTTIFRLPVWNNFEAYEDSLLSLVHFAKSSVLYLFDQMPQQVFILCHNLCGFYSRVATNRDWRLLNSVIGKIFRKCKGFEFYKIYKELQCGDLVLKQTFQLLDQPPLCYKAVPTRHLLSVSHFLLISSTTRTFHTQQGCKHVLKSVQSFISAVRYIRITHM